MARKVLVDEIVLKRFFFRESVKFNFWFFLNRGHVYILTNVAKWMNLVELMRYPSDEESAEKYLKEQGILKTFHECPYCQRDKDKPCKAS